MHLAVENGQIEVVDMLMMVGADIEHTNMLGQNALALAMAVGRVDVQAHLQTYVTTRLRADEVKSI